MESRLKVWSIMLLTVLMMGCAATKEETAEPTTFSNAEPPTLIDKNTLRGIMFYEMKLSDGTLLQYAIVLPNDFDPDQNYPTLLAFPPGSQTKEMVDVGLDNYWEDEAQKRGWVVISPIAPDSILFFKGAETYIPELLARTAQQYKPERGKYHVSGVSNGGISAFRIALNHPELVKSVLALPGFPATDEEMNNLSKLKDIPVAMFVGQSDSASWIQRMEQTEKELNSVGAQVSLEVIPNEGHVIRGLSGMKLYDLLESFR